MPLTAKGEEILAAMQKEYGGEKGESVFYASKNAGKISGVDRQDAGSVTDRLKSVVSRIGSLEDNITQARDMGRDVSAMEREVQKLSKEEEALRKQLSHGGYKDSGIAPASSMIDAICAKMDACLMDEACAKMDSINNAYSYREPNQGDRADTLVPVPGTDTKKKIIPSKPAKADSVAGELARLRSLRTELQNQMGRVKDNPARVGELAAKVDDIDREIAKLMEGRKDTELVPRAEREKRAAMFKSDAERIIQNISGKSGTVKVYFDPDYKEYRCKPFVGTPPRMLPEAKWYFTDDKADAISTAKVMADDPRSFT